MYMDGSIILSGFKDVFLKVDVIEFYKCICMKKERLSFE